MKLAWLISYKSKKTAAIIGVGTRGAGWATAPLTSYVLRSLQLSKTDI